MAKTINIVTLGCSKNLVDSEVLMHQLQLNDFTVVHDLNEGEYDVVMINTCGFIGDAKEESIDTILNYCEAKQEGVIGKVIVFGCLSERYKDELVHEIPEVDGWFGKFELPQMLEYIGARSFPVLMPNRTITTPKHYAFLKISEGCNRSCSFCAIPIITKGHKSKPIEELLEEAKALIKLGVKELIVIAQELSYYGLDLYKKRMLASLLEQLAALEGAVWIRIHYTYPAQFPMDVLAVMAKYDNICAYMDIALQHISTNVLDKMRRNITKEETYQLIDRFRKEVPGIALRTTLLVGHPGETEEDFEELKTFVKDIRFDRLGVFAYSNEENTFAYENYNDDIPQEIKEKRVEEIMEIQQQISLELNEAKIGKVFTVLVDRKEEDYFVGRTFADSPEVDGEVLINYNENINIGSFYKVKINDVDEYDLFGELVG